MTDGYTVRRLTREEWDLLQGYEVIAPRDFVVPQWIKDRHRDDLIAALKRATGVND